MDIRPATLVRIVSTSDNWDEIVNEAKGITWTHRSEVALVRVDPDELLLIRGGADGIEFEIADDAVCVSIDGVRRRVNRLAWHTHPRPTGPPDHDRRFLRMLGQESSIIYEMFTDGSGTRFRADDREVVR
ncbi:MAG TPA: hypothetical protein VGR35_21415 [Tepidisphaeraceae bacterium]|nr:hypothetical protein [Tepidisphaeraceae bacterium]